MRTSPRPLCCGLVCLVVMAGCIPARVPDLLNYTPGPPVIVTDRTVTTIVFTLVYPGGEWKVVTSEASAPPSVYLVAPDGVSFIRVYVGPPDAADQPAPDHQVEQRAITLPDGTLLTAVVSAPPAMWATMLLEFERVVESVQAAAESE